MATATGKPQGSARVAAAPTTPPTPPGAISLSPVQQAALTPALFGLYARPGWKLYPHLRLIAERLCALAAGKINRLMIFTPPRHGKSMLCSHIFPAWYLGTFPDKQIIMTGYGDRFAQQWGRRARDLLVEHGKAVFGIEISESTSAADVWEVKGRQGVMKSSGIGGQITGFGAHLLAIDDPIKNREEADSQVYRDKIWDWYLDVAETRLMKNASQLLIMTRWHEDDLAGRLLKEAATGGPKWDVLRLPALAEEPEDWTFWKRGTDEALCPDLIPLAQLRELQRHDFRWAALYQQRPYPKGGGIFNVEVLRRNIVTARPPEPKITVRGWDLAATEKKTSKRTSGVRISRTPDKVWWIEHAVCGKWAPDRRNEVMKGTSAGEKGIKIVVEQEGGSAGEDQALAIVRLLAGHRVECIRPTGDKTTRADAIAALINVGGVRLVDDGTWDVEGFLSELEAFPSGTYSDQVDGLSTAANWLFQNSGGLPAGALPPETGWRGELEKLNRAPNDRPPTIAEMPDVGPAQDWRGDFDKMTGPV